MQGPKMFLQVSFSQESCLTQFAFMWPLVQMGLQVVTPCTLSLLECFRTTPLLTAKTINASIMFQTAMSVQ